MTKPDADIIAVRCPNWVGDLIMAMPVFECLRENYPNAKIHAVTRAYNAKIIRDCPWIDEVVACEDKTLKGLRAAGKAIRDLGRPDLAILLPNSIRSYIPLRLARARRIVGFRRGVRGPLVTGPKPERSSDGKPLPMPMLESYLDLCRWLGLVVPNSPRPRLFVSDDLATKARHLLEKYEIAGDDLVIGLNPGAKFGSSKCWPPEYFAGLADMLEEKTGAKLLLFVGPGEDAIAEQIMQETDSKLIDTGPDRIDLGLLKPMIRRCSLLITNDTGPRHYATAFDVPVAVIMGPTDPRWTNSNLEKTVIVRKDLPCSPCHKKVCAGAHECMREIMPHEVLEAALKLLHSDAKYELDA